MGNPDFDCLAVQTASRRLSPFSFKCIHNARGMAAFLKSKKPILHSDDLGALAIHHFLNYYYYVQGHYWDGLTKIIIRIVHFMIKASNLVHG